MRFPLLACQFTDHNLALGVVLIFLPFNHQARNFPVGTEENMAVQAPGSTLLWNALLNEPVT